MKTQVKAKSWGIKELRQQFLEGDNRILLATWTCAVLLIVALTSFSNSKNISFFGIADSYELSVNFEYPVEIKKIHVISGQAVEKGQLLAELDQKEILIRIDTLKTALAKLKIEKSLRKDIKTWLKEDISTEQDAVPNDDALQIEIKSLEKELAAIENQKNHLLVYAETSGVVGYVNFKSGQLVPAFTTLMTILSQKPGMIKAYIHENIYTEIELGDTVALWSPADTRKNFSGTVVSIGSRIVEMPERLTNSSVIKVWGREVMIQLNEDNTFLMGEKVVISPNTWIPFKLLPKNSTASSISDSREQLIQPASNVEL